MEYSFVSPLSEEENFEVVERGMELFEFYSPSDFEVIDHIVGAPTGKDEESNSWIIVEYPVQLYTFRVRVSIRNELDDSRPLMIRQIKAYDDKITDVNYRYMPCAAGWNKQYIDGGEGELFEEIPLVKAPTYVETGGEDQALFIGSEQYLKIPGNEERTIDLEFKQRSHEVRYMCTSYDCDRCGAVKLALFELSEIYLDIIYDKPNLDDLTETEMLTKLTQRISSDSRWMQANH